MDIEQTISNLAILPVEERLRIVQELWDSIPSETEISVSTSQHEELVRRIADHNAHPESAISREELERRLRGEN